MLNQTTEKRTNYMFKYKIAPSSEFPKEGGACAKIGENQIAIFQFPDGSWYACENACPHTGSMAISRGIIGDKQGEPKVACPIHKKNFWLIDGNCLSGDNLSLRIFGVEVVDGFVWVLSDIPLLDET